MKVTSTQLRAKSNEPGISMADCIEFRSIAHSLDQAVEVFQQFPAPATLRDLNGAYIRAVKLLAYKIGSVA